MTLIERYSPLANVHLNPQPIVPTQLEIQLVKLSPMAALELIFLSVLLEARLNALAHRQNRTKSCLIITTDTGLRT